MRELKRFTTWTAPMRIARRAIAIVSGSSSGGTSGGSQSSRVAASATSAVSAFAATHEVSAAPTPPWSATTRISIPTRVATVGRSWSTFQSRIRLRPSRTPETVCQITFGTSARPASAASRNPRPAVRPPQTAIAAVPTTPATTAIPKARRTRPRRSGVCWRRFVTATPSWPSRREKIVTVSTASTKAPRPSGCRKRLWSTTSARASGVERPRKTSVSTAFAPALRAVATSWARTRLGVTGGAMSVAGAARTAVAACGCVPARGTVEAAALISIAAREAARGLAAVDRDHRARQVRRLVGGQEREQRGHLLRSRVPPERDPLVDRAQHLRRVLGLLHRREHVARAHAVHAHRGRELERQRPRQRDDARLRRVVVRVQRVPNERVRRRRHEDHAAVPGDHPPRRLLRTCEDAVEVHGEDAPPVLGRALQERPPDAH